MTEVFLRPGCRVFVAGHRGLLGSALVRRLTAQGLTDLVVRTRSELDLRDERATAAFFEDARPEVVFLAAATVGGIHANDTRGADFLRDNLLIQANVIHSAHRSGVRRLVFFGSSCIYPRLAPQPMTEEALLTGLLEPTNEPYAIAKIAGVKMVDAYRKQHGLRGISLMPTNLYGPNDNYDLESSHVLPALIRKFHEAKVAAAPFVTVWGSGSPRREFLHVDDAADAAIHLCDRWDEPGVVNVGCGADVSIRELAEMIRDVAQYRGELRFDASRPDGAPRKLLDVSKATSLGWQARIPLREGLRATYQEYEAQATARSAT